MMATPRPRVLAVLPGLFPSTVINVAKPLLRLHQAAAIDLEISFQFMVRRRQIERAHVLVLCHTIDPAHAWILDYARELGTPLIYDVDENVLEPPPGVSGLDFHRAPERQAAVRQGLRQASLVRTYAPALERYLEAYNPNVVRADGPVDWRLIPSEPPAHDPRRVHVVYATSRLRDSIGTVLVRPLARVLDQHPNVDVTIWGPRFPEIDRHPRVRFREFVRDYDRYFEQFARAGFDIGLAPMPDDLFYQCKTATKFREYAACRIAGIYADTEMYRDCVSDGVTGLLVPPNLPSEDAWTRAIGRLIDDAALRARIQERAQAYARERYAAERIEGEWLMHLEKAQRQHPAGAAVSAEGWRAADGDRESASSMQLLALAAGLLRQAARYAARVPALLRTGGGKEVWARTRAQISNVRQLLTWQFALRRVQRQGARGLREAPASGSLDPLRDAKASSNSGGGGVRAAAKHVGSPRA